MSTQNKSTKSWVGQYADMKQAECEAKAKELVWILTNGGGIHNLHLLDALRSLEGAYLICAAYRCAERDTVKIDPLCP